MSNEWVVYKITSPSGKVYVGSAKNYKKRINRYKCLDCKGQPRLYRSFLKYGVDSHLFEIVHTCGIESIYKMERIYGELFEVLGSNGLNVHLPGFGEVRKAVTDEYRESVSERYKGDKNPMFGKAGFLGKSHSRKVIEDLKKNRKKEGNPMYGVRSFDAPNHILCVHKEYGAFFTLKEASKISGYSVSYMSQMVNQIRYNKTNFLRA